MTRTASRRALLAGTVVVTCGLTGCLSGSRDAEEPVAETYTADELTAVAVETAIGTVDVHSTAEERVDIEGRKAAISRDDLESIRLATTTDDGVLEVAVDRDDSRSLFGLRPAPALDLAVAVPESLAVPRIDTDTGDIDVTTVRGDLTATTSTGNVRLERVDGTVSAATETGTLDVTDPASIDRLETDTGDVTASLPGIDGDASIETTTGAVELRLPDRLDLTLEITTESGEITVTGVEDLPEMAGDSLIEAVVGDGTHRLRITTETGDVTVTGRDSDTTSEDGESTNEGR